MALIVGLDVGTRTVTGAVLSGNPRNYRLVDFFVEEIPEMGDSSFQPGDDQAGEYVPPLSLDEMIQKIIAERGLAKAEFVTAIDSKDCGIREITVPFTKDEQIAKTVAFEAENYFHAFDIDNVVLEYLKVNESPTNSQLVLVAARNALVGNALDRFKRSGVEPVLVDLDVAALANAFTLSPYYDSSKNVLLVDMGATSTKIVLMEGGRVKKLRSVRAGSMILSPERMLTQPVGAAVGHGEAGAGLDDEPKDLFSDYSIEARFQEIEDALRRLEPDSQLDVEEDHEAPIAILSDDDFARMRAGNIPDAVADLSGEETHLNDLGEGENLDGEPAGGSTVDSAERTVETPVDRDEGWKYHDYLERIALEIQRTFVTARLSAPVDLICVTGGLGSRDEARSFLSEEFDVETVQLDFGDFPADVDADSLEQAGLHGGVAIGLAAKGFGKDLVGMNFRKGAFRFEHRFEKLKFPLLVFSILLFAATLMPAHWSFHTYQTKKSYVQYYHNRASQTYAAFFDKKLPPGRDPVRAAKDTIKRWEGKGHSGVDRFLSFTETIRDLGSIMSTLKYFEPKSISLNLRVRRGKSGTGRNRKSSWRAGKSRIDFVAEENDANVQLKRAFEQRSAFFNATGGSQAEKDGFRVSLDLTVKEKRLRELE